MKNSESDTIMLELRTLLDRYLQFLKTDSGKGILCFPPSQVQDVSHALLSKVSTGGLLTFVVSGRGEWSPTDPYFERVRDLARRGKKIERIFLLPQRVLIRDERVLELWKLDRDAGVKTTFVLVDNALTLPIIQSAETLDYGIWDDSVVCFVQRLGHGAPSSAPEWRISSRVEDIELARSITRALLNHGEMLPPPDGTTESLDLEEPMIRSAPFARTLADIVCHGGYVTGESCSWYHRIWQYLRVFDLVSTPTWHKTFYAESFADLRHLNESRVLISGTADYSMLAHVLWYGWDGASQFRPVVLDLCDTPLLLCRWYAQQLSAQITAVSTSIFDYEDEPFDLITTDAFLTRFEDKERQYVLRKWHGLLRPGGRVVTTVRLRKSRFEPTAESVAEFKSQALDSATRWRDFLDERPEDIANMAEEYASRMASSPIANPAALIRLFESNGFAVEKCDLANVRGELERTVYAEVVAVRN